MKGIHISNKMAGMAAVLLSLSLFSCSSEDAFDLENRDSARNIRFGVSTPEDEAQNYLAARQAGEAIIDHFVLRSNTSRDTLCVNTVISDRFEKPASMATIATRATMQKNMYDNFNVVAQLKDTDGSLGSQFYMNETATKSGDVWQPSAIYYWPDNRQLRFMAWAPTGEGVFEESPISPTVDVNKTTIKYTVPTDASKQRDIVAAATDYMSNPAIGATCSPVGLQFKHLCTAVIIKTGSDITDGSIKSVKITNVRKTGTYDMTTSAWTLAGETADYSISPDFATAGRPDGTKIHNDDAAFMMLPQTLGAESKLEVVFHDNISGNDRKLSASLNGAVWPMGKTVTYKLSITPEYTLEFTTEPQVQDAHYVVYPITINSKELKNGWTLTSNDKTNVTFVETFPDEGLKGLVDEGYWLKDYCGTNTLTIKKTGNVKVYVFIRENATDNDRNITLQLKPNDYPSAEPVTLSFKQLCPAWHNGIGVERIQDADYPWGFNWDSDMKIVYSMPSGFVAAMRHILFSIFGDKKYVTQSGYVIYNNWKVTVDFSKVPALDTADEPADGLTNTWELYNFNGVNEASEIMRQLESWGGKPNKTLPENPSEFAAWACAKKNAFGVKQKDGSSGGESGTIYVPTLAREDMVWYLPAKDEAPNMIDNLSGNYWTSTAIPSPGSTAYKYTAGGTVSGESRNNKIHVRAVRRHP